MTAPRVDTASPRWGPGWVPGELIWFQDRPVVTMVQLAQAPATEPFWQQTLSHATGARRLLPLDAAPDSGNWAEPQGFIFHMMRCGSTLVSQLLAVSPRHRVLSEPLIFRQLLTRPGSARQDQVRWFRGLLGLHAIGLCRAGEALFVKWGSAMGRFIDLIEESYPTVPKVFMHRDPVEVLVSCVEGPQVRARSTPLDLFASHLRPDSPAAVQQLPLEELYARYLGSCCYFARHSQRLRLLDYRRLPQVVWTELAAYFGLPLTADDRHAMHLLSGFYSKDASRSLVFIPDTQAKQQRAHPELRAWAQRLISPELECLQARHPRL